MMKLRVPNCSEAGNDPHTFHRNNYCLNFTLRIRVLEDSRLARYADLVSTRALNYLIMSHIITSKCA